MQLGFNDEAYDTMHRLLNELAGYTVEVTTDTGRPGIPGDRFDAVFLGIDHDHDDTHAVRVRRWDDELGAPVGEPFTVVAAEIEVY